MFMAFMWLIVCIAGGVMAGSIATSATELTADLTDVAVVVTVEDTTGFPETGVVRINNEKIAYSTITATSFTGTAARPLVRAAEGTEAEAHSTGAVVRTIEASMLNQSAAYNIAVIADASGLWAAVTIPLALLRLLGSFLFLPLEFLGTDLVIITYLWAVIGIGMLAALGLALAGGRRV